MPKVYRENEMNDVELLAWSTDQCYIWQDEVWKMSGAKTLQAYVKFIRTNYKQLKKLENEKAGTNRKAKENKC